jgi:hypothetical protein
MEYWTRSAPLHLKIAAWHDDSKRSGDKLPFELDDLKKVLMPRHDFPAQEIGTIGSLTVPEVRVALEPYQREYELLILQERLDASLDIKDALKIYDYFQLLSPLQVSRQSTWGQVQLWCTCNVCFPRCVCRCTLLTASLFNLAIRVPADYIGPTVSERKRCKSLKGTAGRRPSDVCSSSRSSGAIRRR